MKYTYSFEEKKKYIGIIAACVLIVIAGIIYVCNRGSTGIDNSSSISAEVNYSISDDNNGSDNSNDNLNNMDNPDISVTDTANIYVHICGAVNNPGLYEVACNSRIADVVNVAGGFTAKAADDYLNLATIVSDGQKIVVPTRQEVKQGFISDTNEQPLPSGIQGDVSNSTKVNINTAGIEELMTIPGVGESKAKSIIEYRQKNGNFKSKEDIMNITGIKEGVYSKISDYIVVN